MRKGSGRRLLYRSAVVFITLACSFALVAQDRTVSPMLRAFGGGPMTGLSGSAPETAAASSTPAPGTAAGLAQAISSGILSDVEDQLKAGAPINALGPETYAPLSPFQRATRLADLLPEALATYEVELRRGTPEYRSKLAELGSSIALFNVGVAYRQGKGLPQDYVQAAVWFRKAAEQGLACAQLSLGAAYHYGEGVSQDYAQAAFWFREAAEQGDTGAQFNLGALCYEGRGVAQNYEQAAVWYRKAAEHGDATAQFNLGKAYSDGQGVPQDLAEACCWLGLAASGKPEGISAADLKRLNADAATHLAEQLSRERGESVKPASAAKRAAATIIVCEKCNYELDLSASSEKSERKRCPNGHRLQKVQSFPTGLALGVGGVPTCLVLSPVALMIPFVGRTIFEFLALFIVCGPIFFLVRALLVLKKGRPAARLAGQYFGTSFGWGAPFLLLLYLTHVGLVPQTWLLVPF